MRMPFVLLAAVAVIVALAQFGGGVAQAQTPTPTPTATPTSTPDPVGGIADISPLAETSAKGAVAPVDGSGWSAGAYAALAGGLAAAAVALGAGAWYGRRRWLT